MSPLWSEKALAHAAWTKALDLGLVHEDKAEVKAEKKVERIRRTIRPRGHSYAL
jgi:hypothetical protein